MCACTVASQDISSPRNGLVRQMAVKSSFPSSHPLFQVKLLLSGGAHTLSTIIDSGAEANIMAESFAIQLGLERAPLNTTTTAKALGGYLLTHFSGPHAVLW